MMLMHYGNQVYKASSKLSNPLVLVHVQFVLILYSFVLIDNNTKINYLRDLIYKLLKFLSSLNIK